MNLENFRNLKNGKKVNFTKNEIIKKSNLY